MQILAIISFTAASFGKEDAKIRIPAILIGFGETRISIRMTPGKWNLIGDSNKLFKK